MRTTLRPEIAFRLTGLTEAEERAARPAATLRPALAARLQDLTRLRYDFPVVLLDAPRDDEFALPLMTLVDRALAGAAAAEPAMAQAALEAERDVRVRLSRGGEVKLLKAWSRDAVSLGADGVLVDCTREFPLRYLRRAWRVAQGEKSERFHEEVDRLVAELLAILESDAARSPDARTAARLRQAVGKTYVGEFDFSALARILDRAPADPPLSEGRRRRIRGLVAALESQRFFLGASGHGFEYDDCSAALAAYRARLPALVEIARSIAIARLEVEGRYVEAEHDDFFGRFNAASLGPAELSRFPDYLVFFDADAAGPAEEGALAALLRSGMPAKVVVQFDDLLAEPDACGIPTVGGRWESITGSAMGLGEVIVLQSSVSHLPAMAAEVLGAMRYEGASVFSVYSGALARGTLPAYLNAAAAMESRAFPAFVHRPDAAIDIGANPQADRDWPIHTLEFEGEGHERQSIEMAFTVADFLAMDARFSRFFLESPAMDSTPGARLVDDAGRLHEFIGAEPVAREMRRTLSAWQRLRGRAAPKMLETVTLEPAPAPAPQEPVAAPASESAQVEPTDEPYIETPRCTSCEECRQVNPRMFAYDANKQAFIADPDAGTYRELVEAAENCQVSIIHPGKPRNPMEPGIAELVERAAAFN